MKVRFDDRLATVMAMPGEGGSALVAKWRQLVDLLAQAGALDKPAVDDALDWLAEHRGVIAEPVRRSVAASLAGRVVAPRLVRFFAEDRPQVAAPLIAGVLLSSDEWLSLLPSLGPSARGLLRHRRDLPPKVSQGLASFGATDFALAGNVAAMPASAAPPVTGGETQIRDLVARIENFRRKRAEAPVPAVEAQQVPQSLDFRFETANDGVIAWVEGVPRAPLIGQSIAVHAGPGCYGVDGQATGAFEKRAPFRDARFSVAGEGPASGDWRISAVPFFDPATGAFLGYRGSGRRPRFDEVAQPAQSGAGLFGSDMPPDSLRQLIHELRTPLNAIVGFAELIEGEYLGPAERRHRSQAAEIMNQASRLLGAVEDLDTAARMAMHPVRFDSEPVDAVQILVRLHDPYERVAAGRGAAIAFEVERDLPHVTADNAAVERMFARLLAATIGLAGEGETIHARLGLERRGGRALLCLALDRPQAIAGLGETDLLDPGYSPAGDWPGAPALGLGFALRLVRNLAEAAGGALRIGAESFALFLPAAAAAELAAGQGGAPPA